MPVNAALSKNFCRTVFICVSSVTVRGTCPWDTRHTITHHAYSVLANCRIAVSLGSYRHPPPTQQRSYRVGRQRGNESFYDIVLPVPAAGAMNRQSDGDVCTCLSVEPRPSGKRPSVAAFMAELKNVRRSARTNAGLLEAAVSRMRAKRSAGICAGRLALN